MEKEGEERERAKVRENREGPHLIISDELRRKVRWITYRIHPCKDVRFCPKIEHRKFGCIIFLGTKNFNVT